MSTKHSFLAFVEQQEKFSVCPRDRRRSFDRLSFLSPLSEIRRHFPRKKRTKMESGEPIKAVESVDGAKAQQTKFSVNVVNPKLRLKQLEDSQSQITVKEFLDFLKTAYQVQENIEGILLADGLTEAVDWIRLKQSTFVKPREVGCQTVDNKLKDDQKRILAAKSKSDSSINAGSSRDLLKEKLHEVLSEGILDSVLPFMVPVPAPQIPVKRAPVIRVIEKSTTSISNTTTASLTKKKSTDSSSSSSIVKPAIDKSDSEVEIHVCDEVKNQKKDFLCNQKLLVEKMGYFAEVTVGQRLEDMEISVHCDIGIFEWLMWWVKKDSLLEEDWPQLDAQCVIPVLVSAAFLLMEPLLQDCLLYCHQHMNEILKTATNLSCLNDSVLTRLAAMYTNAEVESVRDRKDKIQSRLFCKLIQSLCEPEPESVRGHWSSLARAYRCGKCQQLVTPHVASMVPCIPPCMCLQPDGSVTSVHVRDTSWNINDYILRLQKNLRSWRKVYWRLWGDSHFLYCTTCKKYFPAHQIGWCRHHPDPPQFFTLDAQKAPLPVGRYPCCGERAYRFQLLDNYSGCQFREHTPSSKTVKDAAILTLLDMYRHLIEESPPQLMFPERLTRLVARDTSGGDGRLSTKETFWWDGLQIVPQRQKLGLLGAFADRTSPQTTVEDSPPDECSEEELSTTYSSTTSEATEESGGSVRSPGNSHGNSPRPKSRSRRKRRESRFWQSNLSARSNQDIQRAYEENTMKKINAILTRRTLVTADAAPKSAKGYSRHVNPPGGVWVRLESEWKESNVVTAPSKFKNIYNGKLKLKTSK